jgi:hypothetical protein
VGGLGDKWRLSGDMEFGGIVSVILLMGLAWIDVEVPGEVANGQMKTSTHQLPNCLTINTQSSL